MVILIMLPSQGPAFIHHLHSAHQPTLKHWLYHVHVFSQVYSLQLEEDVNKVVFALKSDSFTQEDDISEN